MENFRPQLNPAKDEKQPNQAEQTESQAVESQESEINIEAKRKELYRAFQVALEAYNKEKEASGSESGQWGRTNDENLRNTSQAAADCLDILKRLIDTSENTKYLVIEKNSDGSFSIENSDIPIEVHMDGEKGIVNGFTIQGQKHEVNARNPKAQKNLNSSKLTVFRFIYSPEVTVKPPAEVIGEPARMVSNENNHLGEQGRSTADFVWDHMYKVDTMNPDIVDDPEVEEAHREVEPAKQEAEQVAKNVIRLVLNIYSIKSKIAVLQETLKVIEEQRERFVESVYKALQTKYNSDLQTLIAMLPDNIQGIRNLEFIDGKNLSDDDFAVNIQEEPQTVIRAILEKIDNLDSSRDKMNYFFIILKEIPDNAIKNLKAKIKEEVGKALQVEGLIDSRASQEEVINGELIEPDEGQEESVTEKSIKEDIIDGEVIEKSEIEDATLNAFADAQEAQIPPVEEWQEVLEESEEQLNSINDSLENSESLNTENPELNDKSIELDELRAQLALLQEDLSNTSQSDKEKTRKLEVDIKEIKEKIYKKRLEIEAIRNTKFITLQKQELLNLKQQIAKGVEAGDDISSLQKEYEKNFKETVNILGGLHLTSELENLFKEQLKDSYEIEMKVETSENKAVKAARKIRDVWKKIPWYAKVGAGVGLGALTLTGAPAAIITAGVGGAGLKAVRFASGFIGANDAMMKMADRGRVKRLKSNVEKILNDKKQRLDVESFGELMGEIHVVHALHGDKVISQEDYNALMENAAKRFAMVSENDVQVQDEETLDSFTAKVEERKSNTESKALEKSNGGINETEASKFVQLSSDYRKSAEENFRKSLGERRRAAVIAGGAAGLTLAFAGDALGAIGDAGEDLGEPVNDTIPQAYAESGIVKASLENSPDITAFTSGDTVSGEIMRIMRENGQYVDAQIAAQKSYEFLNSDIGKNQLYELVRSTTAGNQILQDMGYSSLESFKQAQLDYEQIMELSRYMSTGEIVGLENFTLNGIEAIDIAPNFDAPVLQLSGVEVSDWLITEITDYNSLKEIIEPDQVISTVKNLPTDLDTLPYNNLNQSIKLTDRSQSIISEVLGVSRDQIGYDLASQLTQDYFLSSDNTEGIQHLYDLVMDVPGSAISPAEASELNLLQDAFEQLGEDPTTQEMRDALKNTYGNTPPSRMNQINAALRQIGELTNSSVTLPGLRASIGKAIVTRMNN